LYTQQVQKKQEEAAAKQKELDTAKQKLQDMQDAAHKAGVPNSYID
jgi:hypothetical protein